MNNKDEKSKKGHSRHMKSPNDFAKTVTIFVVIGLVVVVGAIFGVNKSACDAVHKVEAAMPRSVRDLEINPTAQKRISFDSDELDYGSYVADVICEKRGIEVPVFYGLNRVSLRYGLGLLGDGKVDMFSDNVGTVVAGYDETYFKSLKFVKVGDKFVVKTNDKTINYKVVDTFIGDEGDGKIDDYKNNLILYSIYSNYGENGGKCFYAVCEKTGEEVNAK